jgi:hypothetical protein
MNRRQMSKSRRMLNIGGFTAGAAAASVAFATLVFAQDITVDLNKFYKQSRGDIASLIGGAGVNAAVIFNNTKDPVTFYVYNYIDTVYLIPAQQTLVAPGHYGTVAASGVTFKINPNKNKDAQFLVAPKKAYVYNGPGAVTEEVK